MTESRDVDAARVLRSHGVRPRRRLGQNFLQDHGALEHIAAAAGIGPDDTVLEIGCGFGGLTRYLARAAAMVIAVELDPKLVGVAKEYLNSFRNIRLICGDILKLAPAQIGVASGYIAAANIPYYVTSPILRHLLESEPKPRRMVLTVQAEVADRVCAGPPEMSLLSLSVQLYGSAEIVTRIPAGAFFPVPKVDSAVVRIEAYRSPMIAPALVPIFFKIARAGFLHKRKTLKNSLSAGLKISPSETVELLTAADIDPRRRAQTLTFTEWQALSLVTARRLA